MRTFFLAAAIVSVAVSARAQTAVPGSAPAVPAADPARQQVLMFEVGLRNAVELGGAKFAERVAPAYPGVTLALEDAPVVRGTLLRDVGVYMFTVEVPDFLQTTVQILNWMRDRPRATGPQQVAAPPRPGMASATAGTVTADPMSVSPVVSDFDPNREYTNSVMAAIVDTMVENSRVLPLEANQTLVIVVTGRSDQVPGLYRSGARDGILTIKASDLAEYRNGTITREEVTKRVNKKHF